MVYSAALFFVFSFFLLSLGACTDSPNKGSDAGFNPENLLSAEKASYTGFGTTIQDDGFVVPTLSGELRVESYTERSDELFVFISDMWPMRHLRPQTPYWDGDFAALLKASPDYVHYVILPASATNASNATRAVEAQKKKIEDNLSSALKADWSDRLHYVTVPITEIEGGFGEIVQDGFKEVPDTGFRPNNNSDWIGFLEKQYPDGLRTFRTGAFIVDYWGRVRDTGSLHDWTTRRTSLALLANEIVRIDLERDIEDELRDFPSETYVVTVFDEELKQHEDDAEFFDVEFPSKAIMGRFNRMTWDLVLGCPGEFGLESHCPEWDKTLQITVRCTDKTGADACLSATKQAAQKALFDQIHEEDRLHKEAVEKNGGEAGEEANAIEARRKKLREEIALAKSSGFNGSLREIEVGRWITSYSRSGRWLTDVSQLLPIFAAGGTFEFRHSLTYVWKPWKLSLRAILWDDGEARRPVKTIPLWYAWFTGKDFTGEASVTTTGFPQGAEDIEFSTVITGHGNDKTYGCCEFAKMTHSFSIDDAQFAEIYHDRAGVSKACREQIKDGVSPNQFGNTPVGRAGWCPGLPVRPKVYDVSDYIEGRESVTLTHRTLLNNKKYDYMMPEAGVIAASAYFTIYEND